MQAMLEHLKKVSQKKSSKTKEKLQHSVEATFDEVERILTRALEQDASKTRASISRVTSEFNHLQTFLTKWSKEVHLANETYCNAMKKLSEQMNQTVATSLSKMDNSLKDLGGVDYQHRQDKIMQDVKQAVNSLKTEIKNKPQGSSGMTSKTFPLLMQALMAQDME